MIPLGTVFALIVTLFILTKDYFKISHFFDPIYYGIFFFSWFGILFDNIYFKWCVYGFIGFMIFCIVFLNGYSFWIDKKNRLSKESLMDLIKQDTSNEYEQVYTGKIGVVHHHFEGENRYLGTILVDGQIIEIIVYSDDIMSNQEKFEILGLKNGKFYCKKHLNEE